MRKLLRLIAASALFFSAIGVAGIADAPAAQAYFLAHCKWHSPTITWFPVGPVVSGGPYHTSAVNATNAWTDTPTAIVYVEQANSGNVQVNAYNYGNTGFDGLTYWTCSGGYFSRTVSSVWNRYYTDGYSATGKMQLMVHELGHALGLAHNPNDCYVIMYPSSARYFSCGISTPQQDDINGANAIYG